MNTVFKCALAVSFAFSCLSAAVAQNIPPAPNSGPDNTSSPSIANPAQGYYAGTLGNGGNFSLVIIDTGEFWFFAFNDATALFEVIEGVGEAENGIFQSSLAVGLYGQQPIPYAVSANYRPKTTIQGYLSEPTTQTPLTFLANYDTRYDVPYPPASVAGSYTGAIQLGDQVYPISFNIDGAGAISGGQNISNSVQASPVCRFSGNAAQRSPATNPYQLNIAFNPSSCGVASGDFKGVMSVYENPDSDQYGALTLVLIASDLNRSSLAFMVVSRQAGPVPQPTIPGSNRLE